MVEVAKRNQLQVVVPISTVHDPKLAAYGDVFDQSKAIKDFGLDIKEVIALSAFTRPDAP